MSARLCYHCGELATDGLRWSLDIDGTQQPMCCPACKAVADTIIGSGLKDYYRHRTALPDMPPQQTRSARQQVRDELRVYDDLTLQSSFVRQIDDQVAEATLVIDGISCAACGWLIEHRLNQLHHLDQATLNLSSHRLVIRWQSTALKLSQIMEELQQLGYQAHPFSASKAEQQRLDESQIAFRRLTLAGFATMQVMMLAVPLYVGALQGILVQYEVFLRLASMLFASLVVAYSARPFFDAALRDLKTRHLTMDVPVSLAIVLAYSASVWSTFNQGPEIYFDSVCMFTFFLLSGRFFEMRARHRLNQAGNNLLNLIPDSALRLEGTPQQTVTIAAADIKRHDRLLIEPGQKIPADGVVESGISSVDEAALTGEYLPVMKQRGDALIGGSHNVESQLVMTVTACGGDGQLSSIMRLIDQAQQDKPAIALLADKIASYFVSAVLIIATATALVWWFIDPANAFWISLSVLVVTCPCALSLATPTALTAATAALREQGLLIAKGHVLEGLNQIDRVIFDKTGTLTRGELSLDKVVVTPQGAKTASVCPEAELTAIAASLEQHSNHPIANAFASAPTLVAQDVRQIPAQGIEGQVEGRHYRIGHADFAWPKQSLEAPHTASEHHHYQWLLLADEHQPLAWFALSDSLRPGAGALVQALRARQLKVSVLSGDPSPAVQAVCRTLGITEVEQGLSPEQKLSRLQAFQAQGERLMMVGDGINDVPTLACADIAVAIGHCSDLTQNNADALITSGHFNSLLNGLEKSQQTRRIIRQNIGWALVYNLIALPLAATGMIPPWAAAIGMSLSSLLVILNALRLLRKPRQPARPTQLSATDIASATTEY